MFPLIDDVAEQLFTCELGRRKSSTRANRPPTTGISPKIDNFQYDETVDKKINFRYRILQESRAAARKPRDAASVLFC